MSGPFGAGALQFFSGAGDFYSHTINQSLRFEDGDNPYLSKTLSGSGGTIFTFSCWVKLGNIGTNRCLLQGYADGNNYAQIVLYSGNYIGMYSATSGTARLFAYTQALQRDSSAWYNIVVKFNGTSGSEEFKIYVNGENQTLTTSTSLSAHQSNIGKNNAHYVGNNFNQSLDMDGCMAEVNFIDGTALDADSFGETKAGIWIAKDTSGLTFGTNGFRLKFQDSSALGDDTSGVSPANDFTTVNGLASTDVVLDSPSNNWCTYNSILNSSMVLSEGNLAATNSAAAWHTTSGTFYVSSGKWYWEVRNSGGVYQMIGIVADSFDDYTNHVGQTSDSYSYYNYSTDSSARKYNNNPSTSYGDKWVAGDIIGVALDLDAGRLTFYKNNTSQGTAFTGISGTYAPAESQWTSSAVANFGQDSSFAGAETSGSAAASDGNGKGDFYYSPPSGFLALCSANLPNPAIDPAQDEQSTDFFNTVTYTGNGTSASDTQAISGVGFSPDFTWIKNRTDAAAHVLNDRVRGAGKNLFSNSEATENSGGSTGDLFTSFDSDGFTVNYQYASTTNNGTNQNSKAYVAWNWLAGGSATSYSVGSDDSTNPQVASEVSANTKAGFSIVTFTAPAASPSTVFNQGTVKHGLTEIPEIVLYKPRSATSNWFLRTDVIDGSQDGVRLAGNTQLSFFDVGSTYGSPTNKYIPTYGFNTGVTMLAYCFHSVEGHSRVGTYTGNGSSNGTFVYTGFRPAFVVTKAVTNASYYLHDAVRDPDNQTKRSLYPNLAAAEDENYLNLDLLSNGFKLRTTTSSNADDTTYFYFAFAAQPFKYSNAR